MTKLESDILKYQKAYYDGNPLISDTEFDKLWDQLKIENPNSELLNKVGRDTVKGKKIKHSMLMGSQEKFNNEADFRKWIKNENIKFPVVTSLKLDGNSLSLQYVNGNLTYGVTRGDGYYGEDVTRHILQIPHIPHYVEGFTGAVRGELICFNDVFKEKYSNFKNPRNFVAGAIKNESFANYSDFHVITYDVTGINTEIKKMVWLKDKGFEVVEYKVCNTAEEILEYRDSIDISSLPYNIDGIVLKQNEDDPNDLQEMRPKKQRAFKWIDEGMETVLTDVEWSRCGSTYTPVGIFEPIDIEGSTVSRASLCNLSLIKDMNLKIGDTILVTKRGMIIPKIEEVVDHTGTIDIEPPRICSLCGSELTITDTKITCSNPNCEGNSEHKLSKWLNVLDVKGFGTVMRADFKDYDILTISDLYDEEKVDYMIDNYGSINCKKAFDDLYSKKEMSLEQFVAGFDIEGIGIEIVKTLTDAGYDTLEKLLNLRVEDLLKIRGWSNIRSEQFVNGMLINEEEMLSLRNKVIIMEKKEENNNMSTNSLEGLRICVTGKLVNYTRNQIEEFIKEHGGKMDKSVTPNTDILVTNDQTTGTSKLKNAFEYGTKIINEEELMSMAD